jgi:hypothetical protein
VSLPASLTGIGNNPFAGCSSLTTITVAAANSAYRAEGGKLLSKDGRTLIGWPTASATVTLTGITSVDDWAFYGCTGLSTLSLPEATSIGERAFGYTGAQELSITLGATAPNLGVEMFYGVTSKTVTVTVPSGASGYGSTPTDTTTTTWGNGFRGGGWDGSAMIDSSTVNSYIDLRITPY